MATRKSPRVRNSLSGSRAEESSASSVVADTRRRRSTSVQLVQNTVIVWIDSSIDKNDSDCQDNIAQLRKIVNNIELFSDIDRCIRFIEANKDDKIYMIVPGFNGPYIVRKVHDLSQVDSIFIFCGNTKRHEEWANDWSKIKGLFTEIGSICEGLEQVLKHYEQDIIPISFVATGEGVLHKSLNHLDPTFMYTEVLKKILSTIEFEPKNFAQFIKHCRAQYAGNVGELKIIDKFEQNYWDKTPIWWYTYDCFLYSMLNLGLRTMDGNIIVMMGFFINDLNRQIEALHAEQFSSHSHHSGESFTVFRGQGLSISSFEKLKSTQGGLISFNCFLSTSRKRDISMAFARTAVVNPDSVGILFVINIDPAQSTTPFAVINDVSIYGNKEDEILFSMHSVFRINKIQQFRDDARLFQVTLTLTRDDDEDLRQVTNRFEENTFPKEEGWFRIGCVLLKMGEPKEAEEIFKELIKQPTEEGRKGTIYRFLGWAAHDQGHYAEALQLYEKSMTTYKKTLPPGDLNLAKTYNNMGLVYDDIGEYSRALDFLGKALEIRCISLPPNHPDIAASRNNIGLVYDHMDNYSEALLSYEEALEVWKKSLPHNDPDLAIPYNNIGSLHCRTKDYLKALSCHEEALAIREYSLPSTHPDLATSYSNIGEVYDSTGDYEKALAFHEKAFASRERSLAPNHPDLAASYNNIGLVYSNMGDYAKALWHYEKALQIDETSLQPNHPALAMYHSNIGLVNHNTGDYSKALSSYKKVLTIKQQSISPNHPDLAIIYGNIGAVYENMGDYPSALSSHEKALEIQQQSPTPNHFDLAVSYNNIGGVYYKMDDYPKALLYYKKTLTSRQQSLSPSDSDLGGDYNNIGSVHEKMRDYTKARLNYQEAVTIAEHSLLPSDPELQKWKQNLNRMKTK